MTDKKIFGQVLTLLSAVDPNERLKIIEKLGKLYRLENNLRIANESKETFRGLGITKKNIDIGKPPVKRR